MRPPRLRNRQSEKKKKTGWSSVTIFSADTGGAILPFGGNFSAVGGFLVFGGSGTPKYGGIFSAVMHTVVMFWQLAVFVCLTVALWR